MEEPASGDDRELLDAVRDGRPDAYGTLFARYSAAAHRYARSLVASRNDADDAVAEVFARLLATLQRGHGPRDSFLPYLLTSIRHECARLGRVRSREYLDGPDRLAVVADDRRPVEDPTVWVAEAAVITEALTSLPMDQRVILWRTEVSEDPPRRIAAERQASAHAVAESASRARRALGSAYLQLHISGGDRSDDRAEGCEDVRPLLAAYVRRSLGDRRRRVVAAHLEGCTRCGVAHAELRRVNRRLRIGHVLPLGVGVTGSGIREQLAGWLSA